MGVVNTISYDEFPKQGAYLNLRTRVIFRYQSKEIEGIIVRDDMEEPFRTIIKLDDGRYILADECQYAPILSR